MTIKYLGKFLLCSICLCPAAGWAQTPDNALQQPSREIRAQPVEHRLIVRFKSNAGAKRTLPMARGVDRGQRLTADTVVYRVHGNDTDRDRAAAAIARSSEVEYVEPDYRYSIGAEPIDPDFGELYGLHNTGQRYGTFDADIDAPEAWNLTTGDPNTVIAVIDTGVDYLHEDLLDNMWVNPGEIPANGIDDDGNGYVDDLHGINCINNSGDPMDDNNHGTHVAGTIGAVGDNGIGVTGVNWSVQIMALKFLDRSGSGYSSDAIKCLEYLRSMKTRYGINVILSNNSWGGDDFSQALYDTIAGNDDADILFVASAGNSSQDNDAYPDGIGYSGPSSYPASNDLPNVISVAATDNKDNLARFSNYGRTRVDLGAPGADILSTTRAHRYARLSGTSMASPHVAGAAALLSSWRPELAGSEIKETLLSTVDAIPGLAGKTLTGGRLNLNNALSCNPNAQPRLAASLEPGFLIDIAQSGGSVALQAQLTACTWMRDVAMTVRFDNGDGEIVLRDDGFAPDAADDDGLYTASWNPGAVGAVTATVTAEHAGRVYQSRFSGRLLRRLTVNVDTIAAGDELTATWETLDDSQFVSYGSDNLVGLYPVGEDHDYGYLLRWSIAKTTDGDVRLELPSWAGAGDYELRLFSSFMKRQLATSNAFRIDGNLAQLDLASSTLSAGGSVSLSWSGLTALGYGDDNSSNYGPYVALCEEGQESVYRCLSTLDLGARTSGNDSMLLPAWLPEGRYELRLYWRRWRKPTNSLVTKRLLTVVGSQARLGVSPGRAVAGSTVTVSWQQANGLTESYFRPFIGLYRVNESSSYRYLGGTNVTLGAAGGTASLEVPANLAAGTYELRYYFRPRAVSRWFQVASTQIAIAAGR